MSSFDFIVDNIRYSYSSISTFENCAYSFKLAYIDALPRVDNFFSDYGLLIHEVMEKFFKRELEAYELSQYYLENYDVFVKGKAISSQMEANYKEQGLFFFDNFSFQRDDYEALIIEDKIDFEIDGIKYVAKPDLILKRKNDGKNILFDYKTALPFRIDKRTNKEVTDRKKIEGYYKQMYLYTYALTNHRGIPIDEISLWFPRADKILTVPWSLEKELATIEHLQSIVKRILNEEEFPYNNSSPFFCENLCGVRDSCEYW